VPISGDAYKRIGRAAAGAVSIVTAYAHPSDAVVGLTVSSFVTLSFDPPLVMFAIQHGADSFRPMVSGKAFGVSLLSVEQSGIARLFASKGEAKITNTRFDQGVTLRVPLIPDSLAQVECLTSQIVLSGDHAIVVGLVEDARTHTGRDPLIYFEQRFGRFTRLADQ
jgi:flavin reductase (DIM6/NTAB) family NADH-FMN oxidoreductase RutF